MRVRALYYSQIQVHHQQVEIPIVIVVTPNRVHRRPMFGVRLIDPRFRRHISLIQ